MNDKFDATCLICEWIDQIKEKLNPFFVAELKTGYAVLGDQQFYRGYTLFICKKHVSELHELESDYKIKFLKEMSEVAEAIYRAFKPRKLNYELLGNIEAHLHWHIFPRYANDPKPNAPIWCMDRSKVNEVKLTESELIETKRVLLRELGHTCSSIIDAP